MSFPVFGKSRFFVTGLLFILVTACFSCRHDEVYYRFSEMRDSRWFSADTLFFHVDSSLVHAGTFYHVSLEITHNAGYPYCNLWFYMQDDMEEAGKFSASSRQYMLADSFGKWYGSGFGALYQLSLAYKDSVCFNAPHDFCIKVVHGMRDEPLQGIEKVGVKITGKE